MQPAGAVEEALPVKTSAIILRVADFLKRYPPFASLEEEALLEVARSGRVRYCEREEILFEEGKPCGKHLFVIQTGAIRLVRGPDRELVDLRGAGDFLGAGAVFGQTEYRHTALVEEDSILYALDLATFGRACAGSAAAMRFLSIYLVAGEPGDDPHASVRADAWAGGTTAHLETAAARTAAGPGSTPVREVARALEVADRSAFVVLDEERRPIGLVTDSDLRRQVATGSVAPGDPVAELRPSPARTLSPEATPSGALLEMLRHGVRHLCVTEDGSPGSALRGVVSEHEVALSRGTHAIALLREIRRSRSPAALRALGEQVDGMLARELHGPEDAPWCARLALEARRAVFLRIEEWARGEMGSPAVPVTLALAGSVGRGESLTRTDCPFLVFGGEGADPGWMAGLVRGIDARLVEAGFEAPRWGALAAPEERCRTAGAWADWFAETVRDPLGCEVWSRMALFDLTPVSGDPALLDPARLAFRDELGRHPEFLTLVANDALGNLPPVTIFEGYAVDVSGLLRDTVDIKAYALAPVSDVARVFHFGGGPFGVTNTLERLAGAAERVPAGGPVFRGAARAFRIAQYFRARGGLRDGTAGDEVRPASLTRSEQVLLRSAFRAIADLITFTQRHYVSLE